jgi:hypothetical protein
MNTGETVELFDGGWLSLGEGLPEVRIMVARHPAPPAKQKVKVGKRVGEWVYELFLTNLDPYAFFLEDLVDLYAGRGAFEGVLADEGVEQDPDRWCSYNECGQELWQVVCQWVWNLRLTLGHQMQEQPMRRVEWALPRGLLARLQADETTYPVYGPWHIAKRGPKGKFPDRSFPLQDDGTLRCPAGATLRLSFRQQVSDTTQRAYYTAELADCQACTLRSQCLRKGAPADGVRFVHGLRHLSHVRSAVEQGIWLYGTIRWKDVAGRSLRRTWMAHWRKQYVEVLPLAQTRERGSPPPRSDRAVRSHHRMAWQDRLARNAWWRPPQWHVRVCGVPAHLLN